MRSVEDQLLYFRLAGKDSHPMNVDQDTALGELLRELREARSLSVKRLAALAGVSRRTIDNTEAGRNISVLVLKKLLRPLGVQEITLRVDGAHGVRMTEGLSPADVLSISDAVLKASRLLESVRTRIARGAAKEATLPVTERAEHLIASFSEFVRGVDDAETLERLQDSVATLYGTKRGAQRKRTVARQRRNG
jgi:transcriptional regulator with XRE-family HTH domain